MGCSSYGPPVHESDAIPVSGTMLPFPSFLIWMHIDFCRVGFSILTTASSMDSTFLAAIPSLHDDAEFCMLLSFAVSSEDIAAFIALLKIRLSSVDAADVLAARKDLFSDFVSFCHRHDNILGAKIVKANEERIARRKIRAGSHKKVIRTLGLNWKAKGKRAACQNTRFSSARNIYVSRLDTPYPPRNHWVVESQAILDLWKHELCHGKLHDKRTKRHPIHFLDSAKLAANIGPTEDAFIYDAATRELICAVIRNFSSLAGPLDWVDFIVQEALAYRKPTRVCICFTVSAVLNLRG